MSWLLTDCHRLHDFEDAIRPCEQAGAARGAVRGQIECTVSMRALAGWDVVVIPALDGKYDINNES